MAPQPLGLGYVRENQVDVPLSIYYAGYLLAILLCRKLGKLFFIPMLLNLAFDIALAVDLFAGWDVRWVIVAYGFGIFVWVLALSESFTRSMMLTLTCFEVVIVIGRMWSPLHLAGTGPDFWNAVSTSVYDVWLASILVVVVSVVVKSTIVAQHQDRRIDVISNPKKRFLLPIGAWAAIIVVPPYLEHQLPQSVLDNRYEIAGMVLVWGWVALEFPFFLMYRRLRKRYLS
jgi:hypothetical protein